MSPRAKRALLHRGPFEDALTWFEIHGDSPEVLEHWKGFIEALGPAALHPPHAAEAAREGGGERRPAAGGAGAGGADGVSRTRRRRAKCRAAAT